MNGTITSATMIDAAVRIFADMPLGIARERSGIWPADRWTTIEAIGILAALTSERGSHELQEALRVVTLAGRYAVPLPIAETMIANHALAMAGLPLALGPAAIVPDGTTLTREGSNWHVAGVAIRVPWGRDLGTLVIQTGDYLIRLTGGWTVTSGNVNGAGMVRDTLSIDARASAADVALARGPGLLLGGATIRTLQMAGGVARIVDLSAAHVRDRLPFGRTAAKLPSLEHRLEHAAAQATAALAAADMATHAWSAAPDARALPIAAARVRVGDAARESVAICQQISSAIGSTPSDLVQGYATALLGWRDEYGCDAYWSRILGQGALATAPKGYWSFLHAA